MIFPTESAIACVLSALLLTGLRVGLRRRHRDPAVAPSRRWNIGDVTALLATLAVALVVRLVGLASRPVDNDEPVALFIRSLGRWAEGHDARLHPPLPALLMGWAQGETIDLDAARGVSVLAGIATVALVFAVARSSGGRGAALMAGGLCALAPAAVHASQLARGYALLACFVLLAHACLTKALSSGRELWWSAYSLAVAAAVLSEYLALAPLLADAAVAVLSSRKRRGDRIGVVGSLGAGLSLVAFTFPFLLPTSHLGIGGGPHAPTGLLSAASDALALLSGAPAPFNALLAVTLVSVAAARRRLDARQLALAAAVLASIALLIVGSLITAVRARYVLHTVPLLLPVVAVVSLRLRGLGILLFAAFAAGHVALLPCYYAGNCDTVEISTGRRTPALFALLAADPQTPIAVAPYWSIAEPSWRLGHVFPERGAERTCPARLCAASGQRQFYGVEMESVDTLLTKVPRFYLLDRARGFSGSAQCRLAMDEADTRLYLCAR